LCGLGGVELPDAQRHIEGSLDEQGELGRERQAARLRWQHRGDAGRCGPDHVVGVPEPRGLRPDRQQLGDGDEDKREKGELAPRHRLHLAAEAVVHRRHSASRLVRRVGGGQIGLGCRGSWCRRVLRPGTPVPPSPCRRARGIGIPTLGSGSTPSNSWAHGSACHHRTHARVVRNGMISVANPSHGQLAALPGARSQQLQRTALWEVELHDAVPRAASSPPESYHVGWGLVARPRWE